MTGIRLYLIAGFASVCCSTPGVAQSSRQIASRRIRQVISHTTDLRKDGLTERTTVSTYNRKGQILTSIEFNADSIKTKCEEYVYPDRSRVVDYREMNCDNGQLIKREVRTSDKWGNELRVELYNERNELQTTVIMSYNTFNDRTTELTLDSAGKEIKRITIEYDNKGMPVRRTITNEKGEVVYERTIHYSY